MEETPVTTINRAMAQINHQYGDSKWAKVFRGEYVAANPDAVKVGETAEQYAQRMTSLCFVPMVAVRGRDEAQIKQYAEDLRFQEDRF